MSLLSDISAYIRSGETTTKKLGLEIEHIMSMGFFHFRVKKYIEIRVADAVPVKKAMGYVALVKGIASGNLSYEEKEYLEHVRAFRSNSKAQDSSQRYA